MPAQSKAQQRLFGMALALRKGEMEPDEVGKKVRDIADSDITTKDIRKFAKTKCKKLPRHVAKEGVTYNVTSEQLAEMIHSGAKNFLVREGFMEDDEIDVIDLISNFEPEAVKCEGDSKSGYGVLLKDKNSDFSIWMDIWVRDNDIQADWNQYIFVTTNSRDQLVKRFQEDSDIFDVCESEAVYYLESNGKLVQNDDSTWSYGGEETIQTESVKKALVKESYGSDIERWVFFCLNYPHDFVDQVWGGTHLQDHFKAKFNQFRSWYGSEGAMQMFYVNLDSEHRRKLEDFALQCEI